MNTDHDRLPPHPVHIGDYHQYPTTTILAREPGPDVRVIEGNCRRYRQIRVSRTSSAAKGSVV
ncbi:MAG: hypothetical protein HQ513_03965 [Rhodospirillales bacterium]|nr:hypothetical protein [Rhodospirillales bacterium]